ncbi:unnamed protein product [Didymodactylos carnosus]|uniref:Uncharacterized protein n=1 Tax=Didymodactylos carnosus TaxID=1234261 RepID=A0A815P4V8_9BILA|nr:unnamed protein product [Didymodactylos carnosus]CAF1444172.1 unnamed protein product [Didymodactylos carnosus]CAF3809576.1 unnamed protein product [Didymodactylos carnosus]CAF4319337.1 unnamed protein product [Didymodactylos carnosus]
MTYQAIIFISYCTRMFPLILNDNEKYCDFIDGIEKLIEIDLMTNYTIQLFDDYFNAYIDLNKQYFDQMKQRLFSSKLLIHKISFKIIKNTLDEQYRSIEFKRRFHQHNDQNEKKRIKLKEYIHIEKEDIESNLKKYYKNEVEDDDKTLLNKGMEPKEYIEITDKILENAKPKFIEYSTEK